MAVDNVKTIEQLKASVNHIEKTLQREKKLGTMISGQKVHWTQQIANAIRAIVDFFSEKLPELTKSGTWRVENQSLSKLDRNFIELTKILQKQTRTLKPGTQDLEADLSVRNGVADVLDKIQGLLQGIHKKNINPSVLGRLEKSIATAVKENDRVISSDKKKMADWAKFEYDKAAAAAAKADAEAAAKGRARREKEATFEELSARVEAEETPRPRAPSGSQKREAQAREARLELIRKQQEERRRAQEAQKPAAPAPAAPATADTFTAAADAFLAAHERRMAQARAEAPPSPKRRKSSPAPAAAAPEPAPAPAAERPVTPKRPEAAAAAAAPLSPRTRARLDEAADSRLPEWQDRSSKVTTRIAMAKNLQQLEAAKVELDALKAESRGTKVRADDWQGLDHTIATKRKRLEPQEKDLVRVSPSFEGTISEAAPDTLFEEMFGVLDIIGNEMDQRKATALTTKDKETAKKFERMSAKLRSIKKEVQDVQNRGLSEEDVRALFEDKVDKIQQASTEIWGDEEAPSFELAPDELGGAPRALASAGAGAGAGAAEEGGEVVRYSSFFVAPRGRPRTIEEPEAHQRLEQAQMDVGLLIQHLRLYTDESLRHPSVPRSLVDGRESILKALLGIQARFADALSGKKELTAAETNAVWKEGRQTIVAALKQAKVDPHEVAGFLAEVSRPASIRAPAAAAAIEAPAALSAADLRETIQNEISALATACKLYKNKDPKGRDFHTALGVTFSSYKGDKNEFTKRGGNEGFNELVRYGLQDNKYQNMKAKAFGQIVNQLKGYITWAFTGKETWSTTGKIGGMGYPKVPDDIEARLRDIDGLIEALREAERS